MTRTADAVFSGGGIKGLAFAGAIQAAEEAGWDDWRQVAGTSAGAICAGAIALGYDAKGLRDLFSYDFSKIDDRILGFIPNYFGHGITRGKALTAFIERMVADAPLKAKVFGDLPPGKLQVVGSDIVYQRMVLFPRDAGLYVNPETRRPWVPEEFPISVAVRISAGYPGFFPPVMLEPVMPNARKSDYGALVDGGVTSGFPIFLFDSPKPRWPTWGFELYDGPPHNAIKGLFWPLGMLNGVINTGINSLDEFEMKTFGNRIVAIPTGAVSALDFNLTQEQKDGLYQSGYDTSKAFFAAPDPTNRFGAKP